MKLADSARLAVSWSAGASLVRDVVQFASMLVLVRLLAPEEYGHAAAAQALFGVLGIFSFNSFVQHALQFRDPKLVDWGLHYSAGIVINGLLFSLSLGVAFMLSRSENYAPIAVPLAVLSTGFLTEIPGAMRMRMLEANHEWLRYRFLIVAGTLFGAIAGISVALLGGGVLALVVQAPMLMLPAAFDLYLDKSRTPKTRWRFSEYRQAAGFGVNRVAALFMLRGRHALEAREISSFYSFSTLGVFSRALGLANLLAGRIGQLVMQALYPILTRAEAGTPRFQRMAALLLQGVCWITIPAAAFLAVAAEPTVRVLYGAQWLDAVTLVPLAAASVALAGISSVLAALLLANNCLRLSLSIEVIAGLLALGLIIVLLPIGLKHYLTGLVGLGFATITLTIFTLVSARGLSVKAITPAFFPPICCAVAASVATLFLIRQFNETDVAYWIMLASSLISFGFTYLLCLRLTFRRSLNTLLAVSPGENILRKVLLIAS